MQVRYGILDVGHEPLEIYIHESKVTLKKISEKVLKYMRFSEGVLKREVLISGGDVALYPFTVGKEDEVLTRFVYLRFKESVSLAPGSSIRVYAKVPVSIGFYGISGGKFGLIDIVRHENTKYGVYGPISGGILAKYFKVYPRRFIDKVLLGEIVYTLSLENDSGLWIDVSKVVVPMTDTKVFIRGHEAYTEIIHVIIKSKLRAVIELSNEPPISGLQELPTLPKSALKSGSFRMEWGV